MRIFGKAEENSDFRDFRNSVLDYFIFLIIVFSIVLGSVFAWTFVIFIETGNSRAAFLFFLLSIIIFSCTVWLYKLRTKKVLESMTVEAQRRELALDYDSAIEIWEELGKLKEAARVRRLKAEQGSVKVSQNVQGDQITAQKVVQGDEIKRTNIRDSVVSRSNVGAGSSKMQELEKLTEMKKEGLIDDAEFQQMKKEILGK